MTAIAHIALASISARSETGGSVAIMQAVPVATATLRSEAGASVATTFAADEANQFWRITGIGSNCWIMAGTSPVAEPEGEGCWFLQAFETIELAATPGQRIAICG